MRTGRNAHPDHEAHEDGDTWGHPYGYCPGCKSHRKPHIHSDINADYPPHGPAAYSDTGEYDDAPTDEYDSDASDRDFYFITVAHFHGDQRGEPSFTYTCSPSYLGPSRCPTCGRQFQLRIEPVDIRRATNEPDRILPLRADDGTVGDPPNH